MKTEVQQLRDIAEHYRNMALNCADAIKFLSGDLPEGFTISFSVKRPAADPPDLALLQLEGKEAKPETIPVISFPMTQEDESFCVGLFMSWHGYYTRKLKEAATRLSAFELVS